ncbi:GIY-YIG nuclease family protein [Vibrio ulleungensis]|uniref:GIY-YIG nuclease family protein n=1 Tax=Vibrio ulleungensis TaxID=2807619 RepID=A0ABS2HAX0_9VIBR|nr:GIY-YIG nuclease family protein [Vibrio ulleungensis]MBM7034773.1 GIY-YIG nuclease family protein [Vibrio ulleungensis]
MSRGEAQIIRLVFQLMGFMITAGFQALAFVFSVCIPGLSGQRRMRSGDSGWVYVISNPSLPGMVKIGMTTRHDYQTRINELNRSTSIPTPFRVEFVHPCQDPLGLEQKLHQIYSGYRVNNRREFFSISPHEVKQKIEQIDNVVESNFFNFKAIGFFAIAFIIIVGIANSGSDYNRSETVNATKTQIVQKKYVVTANSLNVRSAASTNSSVVNELTKNQKVNVIDIEGTWSLVASDNIKGWVASKYLKYTPS